MDRDCLLTKLTKNTARRQRWKEPYIESACEGMKYLVRKIQGTNFPNRGGERVIWSRADSTLIKHSSAFVVSRVREIKRCKVERELPRVTHQEEHPPHFFVVKIRWFLKE